MRTITQRQVVHTILGFALTISVILIFYLQLNNEDAIFLFAAVAGTICYSLLWFAYWRGWDGARYLTVGVMTLLSAVSIPIQSTSIPATALILPILALVLTSPAWVIGTAVTQILVIIGRSYMQVGGDIAAMGGFGNIAELLLYTLSIGGLVLSRTMLDSLLHVAREGAQRETKARTHAEAQSQAFAEQAEMLDRQLTEQRRLLDLVSVLETPAVNLADGVLLAPVVGTLDNRRIQSLTTRLLQTVAAQRTHMVILDIVGVPTVDTEVAQSLLKTAHALRLLGCEVTLTGISADVAASLTGLGVSLGDVRVARSPQEVLQMEVA
jgi:rsbT co-antagonist protein RsbR